MLVGILQLDLYIYESRSLKEKRSKLKSLIQRLANKFNISIAEVGYQDLWNKASLGICLVSNDRRLIERSMEKIRAYIDQDYAVELIEYRQEII